MAAPAVHDKPKPTPLQELQQTAQKKYDRLVEIIDGRNDQTQEEMKEATGLRTELAEIKGRIKLLAESASEAEEYKKFLKDPESPFNFGNGTKPDGEPVEIQFDERAKALKAVNLKGITKEQRNVLATKRYRDAYFKYLSNGNGFFGLDGDEIKALQEGSDQGGGFLVPEEMQVMLVQKKPAPTRMAENVRKFTTGRDHLAFPKNLWTTDDIYTSPVKVTQTGEVPASTTTALQTDPTFAQARIQVYTLMVNGSITRDLLEDSLFDLQQFLVDKYDEAATIMKDNRIVNGTGAGQQTGFLANPGGTVGGQNQPAVVTMGDPITGDGIINLAWSVPEQYDDNCKYVLNKTNVMKFIATLKDSNNRYLFATGQFGDTGIATAKPKELVGYPFIYNALMPNTGSSNYPILFGDLTGYYLVERVGMSIQVLDQTQATLNQIQLVGRLRFGGQIVEDWKVKIGQQHS